MRAAIQGAKDLDVLGVIPRYVIGDYAYTACIIAGNTGSGQILAMGRKLIGSPPKELEPVPPTEFPKEIMDIAVGAYQDVRYAHDGENRELVQKYLEPYA